MKLTKKLQYTPAGQFIISIPNSVVRLKGWQKGDLIISILFFIGVVIYSLAIFLIFKKMMGF